MGDRQFPQNLARMAATVDTFGIPLKKASDIDVLKPLKNLITSRYQTADQESYVSAINDLARLRSSAVCRTLDNHESSLETLYRYAHPLPAAPGPALPLPPPRWPHGDVLG